MISSLFGNFKEVVGLFPVKNMTGLELYDITRQIFHLVSSCGFYIIVVISDNRINSNMFSHFLYQTEQFHITNITSPVTTFFTFDPVHILKNIRNAWLNTKDPDKSFVFPPFANPDSPPRIAKFSDLRSLYQSKGSDILKLAPRLNFKTVFPTNLEREKVSLACNVFDLTTYCALKSEYERNSGIVRSEGTAEFVKIILEWWTIVNVKSKFHGISKINDLAHPFFSVDDDRIKFLKKFLIWLKKWEFLGLSGLSSQTFSALYQCTSVLIDFIIYSFKILTVEFVLPGKLQTDNLEKRFSSYRQLSGGNYNISVTQLIEAEKKLRVKSTLGLKSAKYGILNFTQDSNF